jgi:hypothetical protein
VRHVLHHHGLAALGRRDEEGALAFQGLHFEKGSTQAVHQDTAYVVCEEPMKLCASWIALEDVVAGSGELMYYPGSHRLPDWLFSGAHKEFTHGRDTHEEHLAFIDSLHERSKDRGLSLERFLARPEAQCALGWSLVFGLLSERAITRGINVNEF